MQSPRVNEDFRITRGTVSRSKRNRDRQWQRMWNSAHLNTSGRPDATLPVRESRLRMCKATIDMKASSSTGGSGVAASNANPGPSLRQSCP